VNPAGCHSSGRIRHDRQPRTFQANPRVITASDPLLGDLVNVIR